MEGSLGLVRIREFLFDQADIEESYMELYFIRHGQSANNALWAQTGSSEGRSEDPPLTSVGREQAARVARFVAAGSRAESRGNGGDWARHGKNVHGFGLTHLYCSPMIRAVATGQAIARATGLPLVAWLDLHEIGGIWLEDPQSDERVGLPGRDRAFFEVHYPGLTLPETVGEGGWWDRPFETREERPGRAHRVVTELMDRHGATEDRVAWVSHGGFHNYFLRAILGLDGSSEAWFDLNNVGITRVDITERGVHLRYLNRTDFLPPELIT